MQLEKGFLENDIMADFITQFDEITLRIKTMIEKLDITPATFADKANIQRSTLSQILSGKVKPSLEILNRISVAFPEYDRIWLFFGEINSSSPKNDFSDSLFSSDSFDTTDTSLSSQFSGKVNRSHKMFPKEEYSLVTSEQLSLLVRDTLKATTEENQRKIEEIKIFYTDGSFESFVRKE